MVHSLDLSFGIYFLATSLGITINHSEYLFDYIGVIDSQKDVFRDDEFIYKQILDLKSDTMGNEMIAYDIEVEDDNSFCLGGILVKAAIH